MLPEPVPQRRIVGYYFGFESLDITKCQLEKLTHAAFGFLEITPDGNIAFPSAEAAMRYFDLKEKTKEIKNDLKLMISIGGPEYSKNFSSLIVDPYKMKMLITHISTFIEKTGSDGIDISWKWPNNKGSEKSAFSSFFKELRNEMKLQHKQYLISVIVPPVDIGNWEAGFDFNEILEYVDFFNVHSMDYYGPWANQWGAVVGPTAPLWKTCPEERKNFNIEHTLDYYIQKTGEPEKLNMVIPFFARLWTNVGDPVEPNQFGTRWAELKDGKAEGNPYMSRWTMKNEGWDTWGMQWDNKTQTSFLHNPEKRTYLSLETKDSIEEKMNYADYKKLGGVWIWSVDMGDETNCVLDYVSSYSQKGKTQISKETLNSAPKTACPTIEKTSKEVLKSSPEKRVIGYYSENEYSEITTDQLQKLTHVVFAYIQMNSDGSLEFKNDHIKNRFLDLKNKSKSVSPAMISIGGEESSMNYFDMVLKQFEKSRGRESDGLKVMISIGGQDNSHNFSTVLSNENKKRKFIDSIIAFIKKHQINGADIFWKWPAQYQRLQYLQFLKELKQKMKEENDKYVLSVTVPAAGISQWEDGFDLKEIVNHVDFFNVFTMDYYGPWPNQWGTPTGPTSPLYGGIDEKTNFNVNYTMQYYKQETGEPFKLNIVIPFYVRNWKNVLEPVSPESEVFRRAELKNGAARGNVYMSR